MPNNRASYPEANNITGNVRFSAEMAGVLLAPTEDAPQSSEGANYSLVPTYATWKKRTGIFFK